MRKRKIIVAILATAIVTKYPWTCQFRLKAVYRINRESWKKTPPSPFFDTGTQTVGYADSAGGGHQ